MRKAVASREDDVARKQERTKNYLDELREFKKDDKDLEEFIDKMKGKIALPNPNGSRKTSQECIDLMNKYIRALELWAKFKMSSLEHEEAVGELATAKATYETAKASAGAGAGEEDDSDGSVGGY
jgi:hypothetical protein